MINKEIIDFFDQVPIMALATVDGEGFPNVSAIASKKIIDSNTIWTIDTFHQKTMQNIKLNGHVSIAMWKDSVGYQVKGAAVYLTEGPVFEKAKDWILKIKPTKIVKGVVEIKVEKVFFLTPNYDLAGKEV